MWGIWRNFNSYQVLPVLSIRPLRLTVYAAWTPSITGPSPLCETSPIFRLFVFWSLFHFVLFRSLSNHLKLFFGSPPIPKKHFSVDHASPISSTIPLVIRFWDRSLSKLLSSGWFTKGTETKKTQHFKCCSQIPTKGSESQGSSWLDMFIVQNHSLATLQGRSYLSSSMKYLLALN